MTSFKQDTMNAINDLLDVLNSKGIKLGVNADGGLRIRGDKKHLDDSLIEDIRQHKEQLVAVLQAGLPFALLTDDERARLGNGYEDAYPMSALQVGMVFHTQFENFGGIYHDIMSEHVKCPWDEERFARALSACIQEHPILRTNFLPDWERPLQVVHRNIDLPLEVDDLRDLSPPEQERYLSEWTERRKRHVFDWENGRLFQVNIFRRTDDSIQFVVSFHHAVLDGWSRAVFSTQLYKRYNRLLSGEDLDQGEVNRTYRDFVAMEQRVLADPNAKEYFAEMLGDVPA